MQNLIQQTLLTHLPAKHKRSASGWLSFNAVCCTYNGETIDKHGRGGVMVTSDGGVNYHCFNCQFKTGWRPGVPLSKKFKNLLAWVGVSLEEVDKLRLETLKLYGDIKPTLRAAPVIPEFPEVSLPPETRLFTELTMWHRLAPEIMIPNSLIDLVNYASNRKINFHNYDLAASTSTEVNLNRRIIIPFWHQGRIVGWTARAIDDKIKPKYYSSQPQGYVFNMDRQQQDAKFVLVCEGPFDAMSIDGVAVLSNTISDLQIKQLKQLQRQVILVPDYDSSGKIQIDVALQNEWSVSFPDWWNHCKDTNAAVVKYGKLFTLKNILDRTVTNPVKIELMKKKLFKDFKDN